MLNMIGTGNMRILKKLDGGKDVNKVSWAHFAAVTCEEYVSEGEKKSDFYILKAFGSMADYMSRNLNTPRRAQISGTIKVEKYLKDLPITREVKIGNDTYKIDFSTKIETQRTIIHNVTVCNFLDKKKETQELEKKEEVIQVIKSN